VNELSDAVRAIVEVILRIAEAFDKRDLDTLLGEHYQGPESSIIAQGGERLVGWEAVRGELEMRMSEFEYSRTSINRPVVSRFGDIAVITYEQIINSRLHDIDFKWAGWVTDLLIQREGKWLRIHHHASDQSQR
jgi:ketosteroid isomerase-like protein